MKWLAPLLVACLLSACSNEARADKMERAPESEVPRPSLGETDFRKAYREGIWATMFLNFCNPASSGEASEQMARWWSLTARAHERGLSSEIQAAQDDHGRQMAVMRIVTTCPEGLDDRLGRTTLVLDRLEQVLAAGKEG